MTAVDADPIIDAKLRKEQEQFAAVQSTVMGAEASSGEAKRAYVDTNLKHKSLLGRGFSPFILLLVSPAGENQKPYFYLKTYEKPVFDQTDEQVIALMESDLAEEFDEPFFPVRRGRLGINEGVVSEIRGEGTLGSFSAIETVTEIISSTPAPKPV